MENSKKWFNTSLKINPATLELLQTSLTDRLKNINDFRYAQLFGNGDTFYVSCEKKERITTFLQSYRFSPCQKPSEKIELLCGLS
jgi:hypothetical protein